MSEAAQAILENKAILEQSNIFGDNLGTDCLDAVNTVTAELQKMNTNDKTSFADGDDLYRLMSFFMGTDDTFNSYLKEAMQAGAAMYVFAAQITAMQSMFLHPEAYAAKLNSDDPACIAFKTTKTVGALQQMLKTLCCKVPAPATQSVARNLQAQLDPGTIGLSRAATQHMTPHPSTIYATHATHASTTANTTTATYTTTCAYSANSSSHSTTSATTTSHAHCHDGCPSQDAGRNAII